MPHNERKNRRTTTPNDVAFTVRISIETDRILEQLANTKRLAKASFVRETHRTRDEPAPNRPSPERRN